MSLLSGHGYRYADGHPIIFWLPGFAAYLAAWQALFGISVGTLVKAQIALGAFAALGWTAVALSIANSGSHRLASGVVTALLTAAMVSRSFQSPWAAALAPYDINPPASGNWRNSEIDASWLRLASSATSVNGTGKRRQVRDAV